MSEIVKKEICKCTHCGNESEMMFTCSLEEEVIDTDASTTTKPEDAKHPHKAKATATCTHCGNEADMWIDL